jgi:hypothetical protein
MRGSQLYEKRKEKSAQIFKLGTLGMLTHDIT